MRVPRFRAWLLDAKRMAPVCEMTYLDKYRINIAADDLYNIYSGGFDIMESTGLKDKNGVEIFEDDIVKYKLSTYINTITDIVCYDEECACFGLMDDTGDYIYSFDWLMNKNMLESIEVIGNTYENPELLGDWYD